MTPVEHRTIGVAIALPEPVAGELAAWRSSVGDAQAGKVPPHVTLLPPTVIGCQALASVHRHLSDVAAARAPFEMHLHGTGTFRPISQVVFVTVANGIAHCELLEAAVRSGPLTREVEFPYHPHVTVAHDVPAEMLDKAYEGLSDFDVRFAVDRFTEYEQDADGRWTPVHDFGFGKARGA
ncbi:2'-5' RNA ligase family protein [soil metagenome]